MLVALFEAVKVGRFVEDESAELDEFGTPTRFPQNFKPASGNTEILCGLRTGEGFCHYFAALAAAHFCVLSASSLALVMSSSPSTSRQYVIISMYVSRRSCVASGSS